MPSATQIADFVEHYGVPGLLVLAIFYLINNFETMFKSWTVLRTSRIAAISQALDASGENPTLQECYKAELEAEHFRLVSGIATTPEYRKSVLELLSKSEGKLTLSMIKRSQEFRDWDSPYVGVKLTWWQHFWKLLSFGLGIVNFLMAFLSLFFLIYWVGTGAPDADYQLFGSYFVLFICGAYFFIQEVRSYNNAVKVKQELDRLVSYHKQGD